MSGTTPQPPPDESRRRWYPKPPLERGTPPRLHGFASGTEPGYGVLWLILPLTLGGAAGYEAADRTGHPVLAVLACIAWAAAAFGLFAWARRRFIRDLKRRIWLDEQRLEEIAPRSASAASRLDVQRKMPLALPSIVSVAALAFIVLLAGQDDPLAPWLILLCVLIIVFAWGLAAVARRPICTLTAAGVKLPGHEIDWNDVEVVHLDRVYLGRNSWRFDLVLDLAKPQPPVGLLAHLHSAMTRGRSRSELRVSLTRASETPAVIEAIATELWSRRVGRDSAERGLDRHGDRVHERRGIPLNRPIASRRTVAAVLAVVAAVAGVSIYAVNCSFVPTLAWARLALWLSFAFSVGAGVLLVRGGGFARQRIPSTSWSWASFVYGSTMLTLWLACWSALTWTAPDLWTRMAGKRAVQSIEVQVEPTRRGCAWRITGALVDAGSTTTFCATAGATTLPAHGIARITFRESTFGRHIDGIEPASPAPDAAK